ncbi:hypothetical protein ACNSOO_05475 [Aliarcobacter lanthieri]|uniref:hypothetical protein n=1 Tax=Aliarcobacter lanthieri TaxID=1355374 RepID=UPI003AAF393A
MKKIFLSILILSSTLLGILYIVIFTKIGNPYISKYIENTINNKQNKFKFKIDNFELKINKINITANIDELSKINLYGDISLFDLKSKLNYSLDIHDLSIFNDLINTKLYGNLKTNGILNIDIKESKLYGISNIFDGKLNFLTQNNNLKLNLENANLNHILKTLDKNIFFNSRINLSLDYNLLNKNGNMNINLPNGHFIKTNFTELVNNFSKIDLTKEIYQNTNISSIIDNKKITSNILMISKNSEISSDKTFIDFDKNYIDGKFNIKIQNKEFSIDLKDDLNNPTIRIDLKKEIEKKLNKLENKLDKYLDKNENNKELIKGIMKLF